MGIQRPILSVPNFNDFQWLSRERESLSQAPFALIQPSLRKPNGFRPRAPNLFISSIKTSYALKVAPLTFVLVVLAINPSLRD